LKLRTSMVCVRHSIPPALIWTWCSRSALRARLRYG